MAPLYMLHQGNCINEGVAAVWTALPAAGCLLHCVRHFCMG